MASNKLEVLDPSATVEKLKKIVSGAELNRRHFITALGAAGVAAGTGLATAPVVQAQQELIKGYYPTDILNYLLNIKFLKATFYAFVTTGADIPATYTAASAGTLIEPTLGTGQMYNKPGKVSFTGTNAAQITDMFNEMYYDELNQIVDLQALLGAAQLPRTTINLLGNSPASTSGAAVSFSTSTSATTTLDGFQTLGLARMLEDISATAVAYALPYLTGAGLAAASQILAVDGVHAGMVRLASIQVGAPYQGTQFVTTFQVGTQSGNQNVVAISTLPSTVTIGQPISGTGIPSGSIITAISSKAAATFSGVITKSSNIITFVSGAGLSSTAIGQPITGTNIPALTVVTGVNNTGVQTTSTVTISNAATATPAAVAPTGYLTTGSKNILGASSISGLIVGETITGTGIPSGTTITSASGTTIGISNAATTTPIVTFTGVVTNASTVITSVSSLTGVNAGQVLTGAGIPAGTTIKSTSTAPTPNITMSAKATANSPFSTIGQTTGITVSGSPTISLGSVNATNNSFVPILVSSTTLAVGQPLVGGGIPAGATVASLGSNTVTMSANASSTSVFAITGVTTTGSTIITNVTSASGGLGGVIIGQGITGTGVPSGATIVSIGSDANGPNLTISTAATQTFTASTFQTYNCTSTEFINYGGEIITCPTTEAVSSPAAETLTIGQSSITISIPADATVSTTAIIVTPDPQDVAPADINVVIPGANVSASGPAPAPIPAGSPSGTMPLYEGFFGTAGTSNATTVTPAGFAYARTFSQVLAVLYGDTAPTTYQGGFFPLGLQGNISVV